MEIKDAGERINRYIMECKWTNWEYRKTGSRELIDTLWNVNVFLHR